MEYVPVKVFFESTMYLHFTDSAAEDACQTMHIVMHKIWQGYCSLCVCRYTYTS